MRREDEDTPLPESIILGRPPQKRFAGRFDVDEVPKRFAANLDEVYHIGASVQAISAAGPITGAITQVYINYQGVKSQIYPAPSVPVQLSAGANFDVEVYFNASNPGGGVWEVCATVVATDGTNGHFDFYAKAWPGGTSLSGGFFIQDNQALSAPFVMPAANTTLRITLWGNSLVPNTPPDRSSW